MGGRHKSPERKEAKEKQLTPSERYDNLVKKLSDGPKKYIDKDGVNVTIQVDTFKSASIIKITREKRPDISTVFKFSCNYRGTDGFVGGYFDYKGLPPRVRMYKSDNDVEEDMSEGLNEITEQDAKDALEKIEKRVEDAEKYEKEEKEKEEEEKRQESRKFLDYVEQNQKEQDAKDIKAIEESFG